MIMVHRNLSVYKICYESFLEINIFHTQFVMIYINIYKQRIDVNIEIINDEDFIL